MGRGIRRLVALYNTTSSLISENDRREFEDDWDHIEQETLFNPELMSKEELAEWEQKLLDKQQ